jgi:hypothetical protein
LAALFVYGGFVAETNGKSLDGMSRDVKKGQNAWFQPSL